MLARLLGLEALALMPLQGSPDANSCGSTSSSIN